MIHIRTYFRTVLSAVVLTMLLPPDIRASETISKVYKVILPDSFTYVGSFASVFALDKNNTIILVQRNKGDQAPSGLSLVTVNQRGKVVKLVDLAPTGIYRAIMVELPRYGNAPKASAENRFAVIYAVIQEPHMRFYIIPIGLSGQPTRAPLEIYSITRTQGTRFNQIDLGAAIGPASIGLSYATSSWGYSGGQSTTYVYAGLVEIDLDYLVFLRATPFPLPDNGYKQTAYGPDTIWSGTHWLTLMQRFDRRQGASAVSLSLTGVAGNSSAASSFAAIGGPKLEADGYWSGRFSRPMVNRNSGSVSAGDSVNLLAVESFRNQQPVAIRNSFVRTRMSLDTHGTKFDASARLKLKTWSPAYTLSSTESLNLWLEYTSPPLVRPDGKWFVVMSCAIVIKDTARPSAIPYRFVTEEQYLIIDPGKGRAQIMASGNPTAEWHALGYGSASTFGRPDGATGILFTFYDANMPTGKSNQRTAFINRWKK